MPARHRRPAQGRHRAVAPPRTPYTDAAATAGRVLRTAGTASVLALPVSALGLAVSASPATASPATASAAARSTCAPVGVGASGAAVRAIQSAVGTAPDGGYGPMTAAAVARWQTAHVLPAVGIVGPRTWNSFPAAKGAAGCSATVTLSAGSPRHCAYLVPGSTGAAVAAVRHALGLPTGTTYDKATSAAVSAWQRARGMPATGTVGGATWSALRLTHTPACTAPATAVISGASASGVAILPTRGTTPGSSPTGGNTTSLATGPAGTGPTAPTTPLSATAQQQLAASVAAQVRTLEARPGQAPSAIASAALAFARTQLGIPYVYAGTTSAGYDCSGLVLASFRAAGVSLDRTAAQQYADGPAVALTDLRPGDTVYYATDLQNPATIYHTAVYAGGGQIVEAAKPGTLVRLVALRTGNLYPTAARLSAHPAGNTATSSGPSAGTSAWNTRQMQQLLVSRGYPIIVDGGYGPQTSAAVAAFQAARGLPATGAMNATTWAVLST